MPPETQEALSRRYSDDIVILLQLENGNIAVFNNAREFCGVVTSLETWPPSCWKPPAKAEPKTVDLKELGLI